MCLIQYSYLVFLVASFQNNCDEGDEEFYRSVSCAIETTPVDQPRRQTQGHMMPPECPPGINTAHLNMEDFIFVCTKMAKMTNFPYQTIDNVEAIEELHKTMGWGLWISTDQLFSMLLALQGGGGV